MAERAPRKSTGTGRPAGADDGDEASLARAEEAAAREAADEAAGTSASRSAKPRSATTRRPRGASSPPRAGGTSSQAESATEDGRGRSQAPLARLPAEPPRSVSGETLTLTQGGIQSVVATN